LSEAISVLQFKKSSQFVAEILDITTYPTMIAKGKYPHCLAMAKTKQAEESWRR
jgi:hypothetical protein